MPADRIDTQHAIDCIARVIAERDEAQARAEAAEARLAEVEAERGAAITGSREIRGTLLATEARLAAVLAAPACRDTGHTEALHRAAGCCDPYESPCAAYVKSMRASAWERRGEGDRG